MSADREALVVAIGQASDPPLTYEACEQLADALLARGLRLPAPEQAELDALRKINSELIRENARLIAAPQPETLAWAVVGKDGEIIPALTNHSKAHAARFITRGERVVRVAIRVVDDAEGGNVEP